MSKILSIISIATMLFSSIVMANEVVLQNGLNGYSGCDDTYVSDQSGQNENYGEESMMSLQGYH